MRGSHVLNTVISAIGGAIIGGAITYFVVKKHYVAYAQKEIEETRAYYAGRHNDRNSDAVAQTSSDTNATYSSRVLPDESYTKARTLIEKLGYSVPEELESSKVNVFDIQVPVEEVGVELTGPTGSPIIVDENWHTIDPLEGYVRYSGQPYIISFEDFMSGESGYEQVALSYYEEDDVLCDEQDRVILDRDYHIGTRHLDMFGVISDSKDVVYVRNEKISTEFEVILEQGKYSVRVLGEDDPDLIPKSRPRRMRDSDE